MADPFLAEIRMFPFNFPPKGWAWCDGQVMPIVQNTALFALLGTTYGGNGTSTYALPDLQGAAPMHPGQGTGLSLHDLGERGGTDTVTLTEAQIPAHSHVMRADNADATDNNAAAGRVPARTARPRYGTTNLVELAPTQPNGGGQPHNNLMPYLTVYFCIALQGVFPQRW